MLFAILLSLGFAFASETQGEQYHVFQMNFADEVPNSVFVTGGECANTLCSTFKPSSQVEVYNGAQAFECDRLYSNNVNDFKSCMARAKLSSNIHPIQNNGDYVAVKVNIPNNYAFGHLLWFSTEGDTYIPWYAQVTYDCSGGEVCFYPAASSKGNATDINFDKFQRIAIAEVSQVNIKNLDDDTKPIQIEVPVQIEETVCSAYRAANGNYEVPNFPQGYSDLSANTNIKLTIKNNHNSEVLLTEDVNLPIEADTCAALHAFTWTPPEDLLDTEIKFRVETDVVDKQVSESKKDFHEVIETIYPEDLTGQCWSRAYDLVLTNDPYEELSTSIVEITKGEKVYAIFNAGTWKGNEITPLETSWQIKFNSTVVKEGEFQTQTNDVQKITVDLTEAISVVDAGNYRVQLITRASSTQNCDVSVPVVQNVNLDVREIDMFEVEFEVMEEGDQYNKIDGANISLVLTESHEYFASKPEYDKSQTTDTQGKTTFNEATRGEYTYTITKSGFQRVTNNVIVGSDTTVTISLPKNNNAPTIDLPHNRTVDIKSTLELDLEDYVHDFEDAFSDLNLSVRKASGNAQVQIENSKLIVKKNSVGNVDLEVTVTDSQGASASDSMLVSFIDNNAPVINSFVANPTNGDAPFTTTFEIDVHDADGDTLRCTINYDDRSTNKEGNCDEIDGITHTYNTVGTYNVVLTVSDGKNDPVKQTEQVFVFERNYSSPHIGFFTLESSNGDYIPTDLTLVWEVTHPDNLDTKCFLRINGVSESVNCKDTKNINNFDRLGESRFILLADDGEHQVSRKHIKVFYREEDEENTPPVIDEFTVNTTKSTLGMIAQFTTAVSDADGDSLRCSINFGDGVTIQDSECDPLRSVEHQYNGVEDFTAIFSVTDGVDTTSESITVALEEDKVEVNNTPPVIEEFTADPTEGSVGVEVTFTTRVSDVDEDSLKCSIDFGDSVTEDDTYCTFLETIKHQYNSLGTYTATFNVTDGTDTASESITITVTDEENSRPVIEEFTADPTEGSVGVEVTFTTRVSDVDEDSLKCSIDFGDGVAEDDTYCVFLETVEHQYNTVGTFTVRFSVTDGTNTVSESIAINVRENNAPVINRFEASPSGGRSPLIASFYVDVTDSDGDSVSCRIDFGDGTLSHQDDCYLLNGVTHQYIGIGKYTAKLVAEDEFGKEIYATETIRVISQEPLVEFFTLSTSTGSYILPNDITLQWKATHPDEVPVTCDLIVNGAKTSNVGCQNSKTLSNYNVEGTAKFEIVVRDGYGNSDSKSIEQLFAKVPLTHENLDLEIDSVIEPGDFRFYLEVSDESIARRQLYLEPQIRCNGVTSPLSNSRKLETSAKSSVYIGSVTRFEFITNTLDYRSNIPKETQCVFSVRVTDKYGTDLELNEDVRFEYGVGQTQIQSIRGSGTDIANYMQTALSGNIEPGFNSVEFNLINNEVEDKRITVSLLSRELGINYVLDRRLEPDTLLRVQIPIYISDNVESGMYPVRISFTDENEGRQTRYTYINIE